MTGQQADEDCRVFASEKTTEYPDTGHMLVLPDLIPEVKALARSEEARRGEARRDKQIQLHYWGWLDTNPSCSY